MEGAEIQSKDHEAMKLRVAVHCANAAVLLSSLNLPNRVLQTTNNEDHNEREMLKREIGDLKIELVRERLKRKRIKLCGLMELILVQFVSSFVAILVLRSYRRYMTKVCS